MDHQAFAQLLGNYGEFFGAIAVVATLIYLSAQIRQSNRAAEIQSRLAIEHDNVMRRTMMTRDVAVALARLERAEDAEQAADRILAANFVRTGIRMSEHQLRLHHEGLMSEADWKQRLHLDAVVLTDRNSTFVRKIYESEKLQGNLMPEYVQLVDASIAEVLSGAVTNQS